VTIAIALSTAEGIIFGSDSTTTISLTGATGTKVGQLYNSAQKIFEIGPPRDGDYLAGQHFSGGVVTWGDGSFGPISWRNFVNEFYCRVIHGNRVTDVPRAYLNFAQQKWGEIQQMGLVDATTPLPDTGFAVGAIEASTHEVHAGIVSIRAATVEAMKRADIRVGGDPVSVGRLVNGYDPRLEPVLQSHGIDIAVFKHCAQAFSLSPYLQHIPLRDAIDFVHFLIYSAIKFHRYKGVAAGVGGPIEIATITADRGFRWVTHKPLHESIGIPRGEYEP
jgi:hypothetical protein